MIGLAMHVAVGFPYFFSGLLVPMPVAVGLWVVWGVLLGVAIARRDKPKYVLAVPGVALVLWFAVVQGGSLVFGWTA